MRRIPSCLYVTRPAAVLTVALAALIISLLSPTVESAFPVCNITTNCSAHASSVTNSTPDNSICNCSCSQHWSGGNCSTCPQRYDQSSCSACNTGFNQSTYPVCSVSNCTQYCNSDFTRAVSGNATSCSCACKGQAVAPRCNCPSNYEQNPQAQCSLCAYGYDATTFPQCIKLCNLTSDCPPRTVSVTGNVDTGCHCVCLGGWTGTNCSVCPKTWDEPSGCISCASGYSKINGTCIVCGVANCSFHGSPIVSDAKCSCSCQNKWTGDTCDTCPIQYDINNNCDGCNTEAGFKDVNGVCVSPCTSFENCTNRATDPVLLNITSGLCNCQCVNKWSGSECQKCAYPFDASKSCAQCLPGMKDYPNCTNISTTVSYSKSSGISASVRLKRTLNTSSISFSMSRSKVVPPQSSKTTSNSTSKSTTATRIVPPTKTTTKTSRTPSWTHVVSPSSSRTPSRIRAPTRTKTPTHTHNKSESKSLSSMTSSQSPTVTESLCANTIGDCLFRTNNSLIDEPPEHCFCHCRNQWSEMFCNYCRPRFNRSADCGECYDGIDRKFVIYPTCDHILYITANLTVPLRDASVLPLLVRDTYFRSIAADVTKFLNQSLECNRWSHNITAYVISWLGESNFIVDVELLDLDVENNTIASQCVLDGLKHNLQSLEFNETSLVVERVGGVGAAGLTDQMRYFDLSNTRALVNYNAAYNSSATPINPCEPFWCHNIPPITDEAPADLTWVIVVCAIIGAILLVAAAVYFLWYRPREQFRLAYRYRRGADVDYRRVRDMGGLEVEWCAMIENGGPPKPPLEEESLELSSGKTERRFSVAQDVEKPASPSVKEPPEQPAQQSAQPSQPGSTTPPPVLTDIQKEMFDTI